MGLPGAPSGSRELTSLGTRKLQLSQASALLKSRLSLYRRGSLCSGMLGKYGLCVPGDGPCGLVGGDSKGDDRPAPRGWAYGSPGWLWASSHRAFGEYEGDFGGASE
jgi:hypothetical protein